MKLFFIFIYVFKKLVEWATKHVKSLQLFTQNDCPKDLIDFLRFEKLK